MSDWSRLLIGLCSTLLFGSCGWVVYETGPRWLGILLLALTVLRGVVWLRELWWALTDADEDE